MRQRSTPMRMTGSGKDPSLRATIDYRLECRSVPCHAPIRFVPDGCRQKALKADLLNGMSTLGTYRPLQSTRQRRRCARRRGMPGSLRECRGTSLDNTVDASSVHRISDTRSPIGMLSIIDNQRPGPLQLLSSEEEVTATRTPITLAIWRAKSKRRSFLHDIWLTVVPMGRALSDDEFLMRQSALLSFASSKKSCHSLSILNGTNVAVVLGGLIAQNFSASVWLMPRW